MKKEKKIGVSPERKRYLKKVISRLKLSKKVKDTLFEIALEIEGAWTDYVSKLKLDLTAWESLFLDKPEDRLWHASDKTWWRRLTPAEAKKGGYPKWHLVSADPPPALKQVLDAVENLKRPTSWKLETQRAGRMNEIVLSFIETSPKKPTSSGKSSKKSKR